MSSLPSPYLTPEEYLELERRAEHKSEYYAGELFAMAGGTREHSLIGQNIAGELYRQLRGRSCEAHGSDMRVLVSPTGLYTYPDASVVCEEPVFLDGRRDTLTNPTVVIEVLSESTEAYDRGRKWIHYQKISSLREYLLVSQDRPLIERFSRSEETEGWAYAAYQGLDAVVELISAGCRLALADVYDRLTFNSPDGGAPVE